METFSPSVYLKKPKPSVFLCLRCLTLTATSLEYLSYCEEEVNGMLVDTEIELLRAVLP